MKEKIVLMLLAGLLTSCGMEINKKTLQTQSGETPGTGQTSTQLPATFKTVKEKIINVSCLRCHKPGGKASDWPFTSYDEVISFGGIAAGNPNSSDFYNDILTGNMPQGAPQLDATLVSLVKDWIQAGALNN